MTRCFRSLSALSLLGLFLLASFMSDASAFQTATTPATVADNVFGSGVMQLPTARQAFYLAGQYWVFYSVSGTCEGASLCLYYASSSDGKTWSQVNTTEYIGTGLSVDTNATHIFVAYKGVPPQGKTMLFRIGQPNQDGTITWQPRQTVDASGFIGSQTLRLNTDNVAFIAYHNTSSVHSTAMAIRSDGTNYGSWIEKTDLNSTDINECVPQVVIPSLISLGGGRMYASFNCPANAGVNSIFGTMWNQGWSAEEQVTGLDARLPFLYKAPLDDGLRFHFAERSPSGDWSVRENIAVPTSTKTAYTSSWDPYSNTLQIFEFNDTDRRMLGYTGLHEAWTSGTLLLGGLGPLVTGCCNNAVSSFQSAFRVTPDSGAVGVFWIEGTAAPYTLKFSLVTFVLPAPQFPLGGGGGPSFPSNTTGSPIAEVVLQATSFVLRWPVTFVLLGVLVVVALVGHFRRRRKQRDLAVLGVAAVVGNWILGNESTLFGRYDISFLAPYALREPPLTFTLFGALPSSTIAFGLIMTFIAGMSLIMAVGIVLRDD